MGSGRLSEWVNSHNDHLVVTILIISGCILGIILWNAPVYRYGDGTTYYLQITSIAHDYDIQFTEEDLYRAKAVNWEGIPVGMEVIKTDNGEYFYSKDFTYALFASPFYLIGGIHALLVFNGLLLLLMIIMGYSFLRTKNGALTSLAASLMFFLLSTAIVYTFWIHTEIYSMFILMVSLFCTYFSYRRNDYALLALAGIFFGISGMARPWHFLLFLPFFVYDLSRKEWKRSIVLGGSCLMSALVILAFFFSLTGSVSFYGGDRLVYVNPPFPFEEGFDGRYDEGYSSPTFNYTVQATQNTLLLSEGMVSRIFPALFHFMVGRFTGMVWYYPFTLFVLLSLGFFFFNPSNHEIASVGRFYRDWKVLIITGIILAILFVFIIRGWYNYFGGNHAVGNRYFTIYPAFIFLLGKIDIRKLTVFFFIAALIVAPVLVDPVRTSRDPALHTVTFPFHYFPMEYPFVYALPLWNHVYSTDHISFIALSGSERTIETFFLIEDETEFFVCSFFPLSEVSFSFYSDSPGTVQMGSGSVKREIALGKNQSDTIKFTGLSPVYHRRSSYFYSFSILTDTPVLIIPHTLNNRTMNATYFIGWYPPENDPRIGTVTRWMDETSAIAVVRDGSEPALLAIEMASFHRPRVLQVSINDEFIHEEEIATGFLYYQFPLSEQLSIIRFASANPPERPIDFPELNNNDTRNLSFAFRDVTILENFSADQFYFTGWYGPEESGRWMNTSALLTVIRDEDVPATLSCELISFHTPRAVEIAINGKPFQEFEVGTDFSRFEIPIDDSFSVLQFRSLDSPERPIDVIGQNYTDNRYLSIKIRNVSVQHQ